MGKSAYLKPQRFLLPTVSEFLYFLTGKGNSTPFRVFYDWVPKEKTLGLPDKKTLVDLENGHAPSELIREKLRRWNKRNLKNPYSVFSLRPILRRAKQRKIRKSTGGLQWEAMLLAMDADEWIPHLAKELRRLSQLEQDTMVRGIGSSQRENVSLLIEVYESEGWILPKEAKNFRTWLSERPDAEIENLPQYQEYMHLGVSALIGQWISLLIMAERDFYANAEDLSQSVNPKNSLPVGLLESLLKRGDDGKQPYLGTALAFVKMSLERDVKPFDWSDVVRTSELKFKDKKPLSDRRLREMRHDEATPKDESLRQVLIGLLAHAYTRFDTESEDEHFQSVSKALLRQWFDVLKVALLIHRLDKWLNRNGINGEFLVTYYRLKSRV